MQLLERLNWRGTRELDNLAARRGKAWHGCEDNSMRRTAKVLLRTTVVSCVAMAAGPVGTAIAAPNVTITSPLNGSVSNKPTPSFKGRVEVAGGEVTLRIYKGPTAVGMPIQTMSVE